MSGFKKALVTISEEEYRRLHSADIEQRFRTRKQNTEIQNPRINAAIEKNLDEIQNRQEAFEKMFESLENEISRLEIETERALVSEKNEFYQELTTKFDEILENSSILEEVFINFQNQYHLDRQRRNQHVKKTNDFINELHQAEKQKKDLVLSWLASSSRLGDYIRTHYEHERFSPRSVTRIYQELSMAQNNLRQGMPEAALTGVQNAYLRFSELRLELEQQTFEWTTLFQLTTQTALNLYEQIQANSSCPALDMAGQELPVTLRLNFWTGGQYHQLLQRVKLVINNLKTHKSSITCQQLESILKSELPEFQKEFDEIIYQARFAAINSQLRINIADLALQALQSQGFDVDEYGYESDDMRNPYCLRMKNIEGSQVTIRVNPVDNQENKNNIILESHDSFEKTEHELRLRANEIRQTLLQHGLRIGNMDSQNQDTGALIEIPNRQTDTIKKVFSRI